MTRKYLLISLLLILIAPVKAQTEDLESWWNFTLKGRFNKKLNYTIEPELRLYDNSSRIRNWQTEGSLGYEVIKNIEVGGLYRYEVNYLKQEYNRRIHRASAFIKYKHETGRIEWSYRGIWQNEFVNIVSSDDGHINHMGHRHKLSVVYDYKKWPVKPSLGVEYYFPIAPDQEVGEWKKRWFMSLEKDISKRWSTKFSYRRQLEYNVANPFSRNIITVGLEYQPKFLKGKKKKKDEY